ncbi:hypothetical protein BpHYR1_045603 [Brachionus plicatilis]|uniref:Uncharacterized protein n=1 Tax=Brachionus plicatilis TaxID=10195 RepID=A0A3M7S6H8_BRAPC|nr:hypothetical protein BpHYR1_045603 [Brachionus plicatilis]
MEPGVEELDIMGEELVCTVTAELPGMLGELAATLHALHSCVIAGLGKQFQTDSSLPLPFGASVLIPCLYLCVAQIQPCCQFHPILNTQVFLSLKALLQTIQLMVCERCSRLPRLFRLAIALAIICL